MTVRPSLAASEAIDLEGGSPPSAGNPGEMVMRIMRAAFKLQASDVHLRVGAQPIVRLEGELRPLNHPALDLATVAGAAHALAE
ncbi:MAG TPA: hypothetical protein VI299_27575, partial [Polyangiales bacterium]